MTDRETGQPLARVFVTLESKVWLDEYIVAAVSGLSVTKLLEPSARAEFTERIAKAGERIILVENETRSIDVRMMKLQ